MERDKNKTKRGLNDIPVRAKLPIASTPVICKSSSVEVSQLTMPWNNFPFPSPYTKFMLSSETKYQLFIIKFEMPTTFLLGEVCLKGDYMNEGECKMKVGWMNVGCLFLLKCH